MTDLSLKVIDLQTRAQKLTADIPAAWYGALEALPNLNLSLPKITTFNNHITDIVSQIETYIKLYDQLTISETDLVEGTNPLIFFLNQSANFELLKDPLKYELAKNNFLKDRNDFLAPEVQLQKVENLIKGLETAIQFLYHGIYSENAEAFSKSLWQQNGEIGFVYQAEDLSRLLQNTNLKLKTNYGRSLASLGIPDTTLSVATARYDGFKEGIMIIYAPLMKNGHKPTLHVIANDNSMFLSNISQNKFTCFPEEPMVMMTPKGPALIVDLSDINGGEYIFRTPDGVKEVYIVGNNCNINYSNKDRPSAQKSRMKVYGDGHTFDQIHAQDGTFATYKYPLAPGNIFLN